MMVCKKEDSKMKNQFTQEQINLTMALALMKYLYNNGKISENVYRKIIVKYGKKAIVNIEELC